MSQSYADKAIPVLNAGAALNLRRASIPVDLDDPRARESLVDVRGKGVAGDNFYARRDGSNPPYGRSVEGAIAALFLRESVAEKLARADSALKGIGLSLYILDGYRPVSVQRGLWRFFREHFARTEPSLSEAEIEARTLTFVSDPRRFRPDDPRTWPLHSTGGAVDLTLTDSGGKPVDLGTAFDDASEAARTSYFEEALARGEIAADDPRLRNRRILYWTMRDAGFTNYLHEWWHYDWGDQMHVLTLELLGEPLASGAAWYGYVEPPAAAPTAEPDR